MFPRMEDNMDVPHVVLSLLVHQGSLRSCSGTSPGRRARSSRARSSSLSGATRADKCLPFEPKRAAHGPTTCYRQYSKTPVAVQDLTPRPPLRKAPTGEVAPIDRVPSQCAERPTFARVGARRAALAASALP